MRGGCLIATPYENIYERALFKVKDLKLGQMDESKRRYVLWQYLNSAVADFCTKCSKDLDDRDNEAEEFAADLTNEEQEILALGVAYYWLSAKIMDRDLIRNKISTKDYQYFSPANLMREINTMRESVRKGYKHRITDYTYDHGDLAMGGNT